MREITQGNTNMNLKLNSLSKGRQSYQNRPGKEQYKSIEERKAIQGGTQQIVVPKMQQQT